MTPKQTLIMWCLLGNYGEAPQREILPRIQKKDREALVSNGFITTKKIGRAISLKVEDKGWRWANEHLGDTLPPNYQVLQNWLAKVHQILKKMIRPLPILSDLLLKQMLIRPYRDGQ